MASGNLVADPPVRPGTAAPKDPPVATPEEPFLTAPDIPGLPPGIPLPILPPGAPLPPAPTHPVPPGQTPPLQPVVRLSESRMKMGQIEFDARDRTLTFPAQLNMNEGMLEYLIVTDYGKVHEALLSTNVSPFHLNLVMLLLKYEKADNFFPHEQEAVPAKPKPVLNETNSFDVKLRYTDESGKEQTVFLADWLHNELTKGPAKRAPWVYTGSEVDPNGSFHAQIGGSIIAVYTDTLAMINSPLEGSDNDEIWVPAPNLPPLKSEVQVIFAPHRDEDLNAAPAKQ